MTISNAVKAALFKQETEEVFLVLLTIDHPELSNPIRLVNNTEDITSNGNLFTAFPFKIVMPLADPNSQPRASIEVDNIDRQIVTAIRTITSSPTVTLQVIMASAPNTIEVEFTDFKLQDTSYNGFTVSGTLSMENYLLEPYPADQFVPSNFPGIF